MVNTTGRILEDAENIMEEEMKDGQDIYEEVVEETVEAVEETKGFVARVWDKTKNGFKNNKGKIVSGVIGYTLGAATVVGAAYITAKNGNTEVLEILEDVAEEAGE